MLKQLDLISRVTHVKHVRVSVFVWIHSLATSKLEIQDAGLQYSVSIATQENRVRFYICHWLVT